MKIRELCNKLGYEYDPNHSKRCLDKIKKDYLIEQVGQKNNYNIIRELTLDEKRELNQYIKMRGVIKDVIIATLSMIEGNEVCGSIKDFYELFTLVNKNYKWFKFTTMSDKKRNYIKDNNINEDNITIYHDFSKEIDGIYHKAMKECLEQLEKEMLIYINKELTFVYIDENGFHHQKIATKEETEKLLEVGREVMDKYNYESYDKILFYDKEKIKNEICDIMNIDYFYNQYRLILNKKYLNSNYEFCLELKKQVNELSAKKLSLSKQGVLKEYDSILLNDCIDTLVRI